MLPHDSASGTLAECVHAVGKAKPSTSCRISESVCQCCRAAAVTAALYAQRWLYSGEMHSP